MTPKILISERNRLLASYFQGGLERGGYQVFLASDPESTLERVQNIGPDLLLIDLPEGAEESERLRQRIVEWGGEAPILLIGSLSDRERRREVVEGYGAEGYFAKPFEMKVLLDQVSSLLKPAGVTEGEGVRTKGVVKEHGDLSTYDVAQILADLHSSRDTGALRLERGEVSKKIYLESGRFVFALSNQIGDRLGSLLIRRGKLTAEELGDLWRKSQREKRLLGEVLVESQVVSSEELSCFLKEQMRDIVLSLFSWQEGRYEFQLGERWGKEGVDPGEYFPQWIVEGVWQGTPLKRLVQRLGSTRTRFAFIENRALTLDRLNLNPFQHVIASLIDGKRDLSQIVHQSRLDPVMVFRLLYAFRVLRLIEAQEEEGFSESSGERSFTDIDHPEIEWGSMGRSPHGELSFQIGVGNYLEGDRLEAIRSFQEAIRLSPLDPDYHLYLALVLSDQKPMDDSVFQEAFRHLQKAAELSPQDPHYLLCLGHLVRSKGDREGAGLYYRRALEIDPSYGEAARILKEMGVSV